MKEIHLQVMQGNNEPVPSVFNLFACKCPRCRKGDMFEVKNPYKLKSTMKMHRECPVCKQPFAIEVGFYYGSSYVSYALSIAISVASLIAWWVIVGLGMNDNRFFVWLAVNAVLLVALQPPLMRLARTIWLAFFVRYDREWRTNPPENVERSNSDQENNW